MPGCSASRTPRRARPPRGRQGAWAPALPSPSPGLPPGSSLPPSLQGCYFRIKSTTLASTQWKASALKIKRTMRLKKLCGPQQPPEILRAPKPVGGSGLWRAKMATKNEDISNNRVERYYGTSGNHAHVTITLQKSNPVTLHDKENPDMKSCTEF